MSTTPRSTKKRALDPIVINEEKDLVFANEEDLYEHFEDAIHVLEAEFSKFRGTGDITEPEFKNYDQQLERTLDDPDEVWEDEETLTGDRIYMYIRQFDDDVAHVAVCYLTGATPSFVYLHFPTTDRELVERYRRGEMLFARGNADVALGAIEGDALHEADELADGLYRAMLLLRSEKDIPEDEFLAYADFREDTLEDADEIWRSADSLGNVLVSFIKEFNEDEDFAYVVVTVEDEPSGSHALLFSFPTRDRGLADRYRHGENLQAEEVVQENSH